MTLNDITSENVKTVDETKEALLTQTFEMYYDKIYSFFFYHIHNHEQAQDLAGEVFCKIASAWSTYDPEKAAISTWVFSIAKNLLRDVWRKRKLVEVELLDIAVSVDLDAGPELMEQSKLLCKALRSLTDRERELIALKFIGDLNNAEIASLTNFTPNYIRVTIFRALKKLQCKLEDDQA